MNRTVLKMVRYRPLQFMRSPGRGAIPTRLAAVFSICLAGAVAVAAPLPQNDLEQTPTVRERVMAMPPHTMVQVRLHNKSIRGRVSVVTHKGLLLQIAADGKTRNERISYDDVESIEPVEGNGKGASFSIHVAIDGGSGGGVDVQIDH